MQSKQHSQLSSQRKQQQRVARLTFSISHEKPCGDERELRSKAWEKVDLPSTKATPILRLSLLRRRRLLVLHLTIPSVMSFVFNRKVAIGNETHLRITLRRVALRRIALRRVSPLRLIPIRNVVARQLSCFNSLGYFSPRDRSKKSLAGRPSCVILNEMELTYPWGGYWGCW